MKKASVFAKQMYREGKLKTCKDLDDGKKLTSNDRLSRSTLLTGSGLGEVTGDSELQRIHNENADRLNSMDEKEILEEKEKLLKTLGEICIFSEACSTNFDSRSDPKLIAFIRRKHKTEGAPAVHSSDTTTMSSMHTDERKDAPTVPIEVDSRWMHMDTVEAEKLEWMKDLPAASAARATDDSVREHSAPTSCESAERSEPE